MTLYDYGIQQDSYLYLELGLSGGVCCSKFGHTDVSDENKTIMKFAKTFTENIVSKGLEIKRICNNKGRISPVGLDYEAHI